MKRLIKKAEYEDFIQEWFNSWSGVSNQQVEEIIKENPQFAYSDLGWRWIGFKDLKQMILSNVEIHDDPADNYLNYDEILDIVGKQIRNETRYCSWSQDYGDAETYAEKQIEEYDNFDSGVVIEANITGLDYKEFLIQYDPDMEELATEENEVIGKANGFKIVGLTIAQKGVMYLYDSTHPCTIYYDENDINIE